MIDEVIERIKRFIRLYKKGIQIEHVEIYPHPNDHNLSYIIIDHNKGSKPYDEPFYQLLVPLTYNSLHNFTRMRKAINAAFYEDQKEPEVEMGCNMDKSTPN